MNTEIHWPALLHYQGDPELAVIHSLADWQADYAQHFFAADDRLTDSEGQCYLLQQRVKGQVLPEPVGLQLPLSDINALLRAHFAAAGHCCVAKMLVSSASEAVQAVIAAESFLSVGHSDH